MGKLGLKMQYIGYIKFTFLLTIIALLFILYLVFQANKQKELNKKEKCILFMGVPTLLTLSSIAFLTI